MAFRCRPRRTRSRLGTRHKCRVRAERQHTCRSTMARESAKGRQSRQQWHRARSGAQPAGRAPRPRIGRQTKVHQTLPRGGRRRQKARRGKLAGARPCVGGGGRHPTRARALEARGLGEREGALAKMTLMTWRHRHPRGVAAADELDVAMHPGAQAPAPRKARRKSCW